MKLPPKNVLFNVAATCVFAMSSLDGYITDMSLYGGCAKVETNDRVYAPKNSNYAHTISKLDWKVNDVWVIGAIGKVFCPKNQMHLLVDAWTKVNSPNGKMIDRDYLNKIDHTQLTDISIHSNTKLKTAYAIDVEFGKGFQLCRELCSPWTFEYLLGVKYIRYEWEVNGGRYSYLSGTRVGRFPNDLKVMVYSQQLTIPYLGIQGNWQCSQRWNFKLFGKYSPLGYVLCHDNHLLRSTTFTSEHWCSQYWILGAEAAWQYSDQIRAYLKYSYDQLNLSKGNIKMHEEDGRSFYRNAAGVGGNLQMITLGVSARF